MPDATTVVAASAPGKMVLSGEYAVLDGAPAISMAVNRRARVTLSVSDDGCHTVTAPGRSAATGVFRTADGVVEWLEGKDEFALVDVVWRTACPITTDSFAMTLDSDEFIDGDSKFGLGSSAALTVALAHALCRVASTGTDATRIAFAAHRALQGGLGSGVDVACSAEGGLVEYTMGGTATRRLYWPVGLRMGIVWVGAATSTRARLEQLRRRQARPSRAALVLASRRVARAWRRKPAASILDEYHDYTSVLREFSDDHQLGIFDAGHAELTDEGRRRGVVYKPCGAGGGDTGIVLASDAAAVGEFLAEARRRGFAPLDSRLDELGVAVEEISP